MILPWNYNRNKTDLRWSVSSGSLNALLWDSTLTKQTLPTGPSIQKMFVALFSFFSALWIFFMARSPLNVYKCDILQSEWCKALKKRPFPRPQEAPLRHDRLSIQFTPLPEGSGSHLAIHKFCNWKRPPFAFGFIHPVSFLLGCTVC